MSGIMQIIRDAITVGELNQIAAAGPFDKMVKAVVDIERELIAIDAELHSDLEALLLEDASQQKNLWGINFYPEVKGEGFIEFDSMINMRPSQGNRSRGVDDESIRRRITEITAKKVLA